MSGAGFRCGTIGIIGRPNTGKSSLLNRFVGQKLSIVSSKAQTTRHLVTGIVTTPDCQFVFVDSPGFQTLHNNVLNQALNTPPTAIARPAYLVLFVLEAPKLFVAVPTLFSHLPPIQ